MEKVLPVSLLEKDELLEEELKKARLGLTAQEARKIASILGRDPSIVECFILDIEWSEHCSYKSSAEILKKSLPLKAPNVIQSIEEDAGIIALAVVNGRRYGVVIAHESHNHPSQVLPVEGAATGIGGVVRDVDCMGARVVAVADPLRFGDVEGGEKEKVRWIARGVVQGIWEYGNALGVPNIGGDVYFDESFDDNCLVNVVALGVIREDEIIHSRAPEGAGEKGYDVILVGKPTDDSGFGGVTFASQILDGGKEEERKGAVQVHDPFLKNVLLMRKSNSAVWKLAREKGMEIGFKDLGGGGLACASSEMGAAGSCGIDIDLEKVHVSMPDMLPEVIACGETQERYLLIVPPELTEEVLRIYNEDWDLPNIYEGARASVIGKVIPGDRYVMRWMGEVVCDIPIHELTKGICYERQSKPIVSHLSEPEFQEPDNLGEVLLKVLGGANVSSREAIFRFYDTEVQGNAVIRPGEADAGVIAPLEEEGSRAGIALSTDGNPLYGLIDPYWGGANAVAEAMRNVACVGAVPSGLTDCLNYGNPEKPEAFWQFKEGVRGVSDAAKNLWLKGHPEMPVPIVSGNVSFYNESAAGKSIAPSPIIACVGVMEDYSRALTMRFKEAGSRIYLVGGRYDELGGSEYYRRMFGVLGKNVPQVRYEKERGAIYAVIDCISAGYLLAAHDISGGGLAVTLSEMLVCGRHQPACKGAEIDLESIDSPLRDDKKLFSESSGFVLEVSPGNSPGVEKIFAERELDLFHIGSVMEEPVLTVGFGEREVLRLSVSAMEEAWRGGMADALR